MQDFPSAPAKQAEALGVETHATAEAVERAQLNKQIESDVMVIKKEELAAVFAAFDDHPYLTARLDEIASELGGYENDHVYWIREAIENMNGLYRLAYSALFHLGALRQPEPPEDEEGAA